MCSVCLDTFLLFLLHHVQCTCIYVCSYSLKSGCLDVRRLMGAGITKIGLGTGERCLVGTILRQPLLLYTVYMTLYVYIWCVCTCRCIRWLLFFHTGCNEVCSAYLQGCVLPERGRDSVCPPVSTRGPLYGHSGRGQR